MHHTLSFPSLAHILAHYDQLAEEILYQTDGRVDAVVVGVGTGGTIAGIARKIKERSPSTIVVGADPIGSILALPGELNVPGGSYKVEGIGYDFIPRTCARECIDCWYKTEDVASLTYARKLIRREGLLVGGSAGAVVDSALRFIKEKGWENDKTKRVVCVFQDSIRNYITKFLSKEWCVENQILPYEELKEEHNPYNGQPLFSLALPEINSYDELTVGQAKYLFEKGEKIIPIRVGDAIDSAILPKKFLELIVLKKLKLTDSALKTKTKDFVIVPDTLDVAQLTKYSSHNPESSSATTPCWCRNAALMTPRSRSCGWPLPTTPFVNSPDLSDYQ
jgi:cystathionine beta-synthase